MYVITVKENNGVLAASNDCGLVKFSEENGYERTSDRFEAIGYMDFEHNVVYPQLDFYNLDNTTKPAPEDFSAKPGYYCFTEAKGFYVNPDWQPPEPSLEEKIEQLIANVDYISMQTGVEL